MSRYELVKQMKSMNKQTDQAIKIHSILLTVQDVTAFEFQYLIC